MSGPSLSFYNAFLLRNHAITEEDLWICQGKIIPPQKQADVEIDAEGLLIAPGYVDLQVNGAAGYDFSSKPDVLHYIAKSLPKCGVTSFLATMISSDLKQYHKLLPGLKGSSEGAECLGIHLEGPFLNPTFAGAHPKEVLCPYKLSLSALEECYGSLERVKMITLAPELPGAFEVIHALKKKGIIVSLGHSAATFAEAKQALSAGATCVTHLFNAMAPFHQREPGLIGLALTDKQAHFSLIVDGRHLHPAVVKLAWNSHPDGLFLVSDCTAALGAETEVFSLGQQKIRSDQHGVHIAGEQKLAGSALGLDACVRQFHKTTGCTIVQAIEAASLKPAQLLGLKHKGTLEIGADADFIFLDDALNVKRCFIAGHEK